MPAFERDLFLVGRTHLLDQRLRRTGGHDMIMLGHGSIVAEGAPDEIRNSPNQEVQQFIHGRPDGPIPLNLSQEEHKDHQLVRPRPFLGGRFRFHHKHS